MQRLLAVLTVLLACLLGLPAAAHATNQAAPAPIGGGSLLFTSSGARCTAAFAARSGSTGYLIAGPGCSGSFATLIYSGNNVLVGQVTGAPLGYSVIKVTNTVDWQLVGWIDTGVGKVSISGSAEAPVGAAVCLLSRSAGTRCGTIVAKNQTISYPEGVISGVTRTNICIETGSRPIAFVSGSQAQGVPIGGTSSCSGGGSSYFTPINRILSAYGLALLTG